MKNETQTYKPWSRKHPILSAIFILIAEIVLLAVGIFIILLFSGTLGG